MIFSIPNSQNEILKTLNAAGYEAYLVGGCVRDMLLGHTPCDYDITTNALPHEIKALFNKTFDTGIKHGTVTVIECGVPTEVTTFRTEGGYSDSRHPDNIEFVSDIKLDLSRRDFTVNAICYNPSTGMLDYFGGIEDIKNKILRTVGNPRERFREDALRIMRLFRFSATLGFEIENESYNAAIQLSHTLADISRERIAAELSKAICGAFPDAVKPLCDCGALSFCGINPAKLQKLSLLKDDLNLRLYGFLKLCSDNPLNTLNELKFPNKTKDYFKALDYLENNICALSDSDIKHLLGVVSVSQLEDFCEYQRVFFEKDIFFALEAAKRIIENNEPYKISQLDISGNELLALGIKGEKIGEALKLLLEAVIQNKDLNQKQALINLAKQSVT